MKEETWTDKDTGLMWQVNHPDEEMTWDEAIEYCHNLNYGGYSDWRLPTIKELYAIVDPLKCKPACKIKNTECSYYWSASSRANTKEIAWQVNFYYGYVYYSNKSNSYYARAVRGGK